MTLDQPELKIDVQIKEQITELKAVVISAGTFEAGDKGRTTVLNSIDIATTASGMGDITGALKTLPGAQQVGETEGLFVRAAPPPKHAPLSTARPLIISFTAAFPIFHNVDVSLLFFLKEPYSAPAVIPHCTDRHYRRH